MTKKRLLENSPDSRPLEGLCGDAFVPRLPQTDVYNTTVEGVDRNTQVNHRVPPARQRLPTMVRRGPVIKKISQMDAVPAVDKDKEITSIVASHDTITAVQVGHVSLRDIFLLFLSLLDLPSTFPSFNPSQSRSQRLLCSSKSSWRISGKGTSCNGRKPTCTASRAKWATCKASTIGTSTSSSTSSNTFIMPISKR